MENKILKTFDKTFTHIGRDNDGDLYLLSYVDNEEIIIDNYNDLFKSIKRGDSIEIKELENDLYKKRSKKMEQRRRK